jgi:hypothetical protein
MSADGIEVDPAGLNAVAPQYTELATQLSQARSVLMSALDGLGNYWGDDEAGRQYARNHLPGRDAALQYHGDLIKGVTDVGGGVAGWATGYSTAESSLVEGM